MSYQSGYLKAILSQRPEMRLDRSRRLRKKKINCRPGYIQRGAACQPDKPKSNKKIIQEAEKEYDQIYTKASKGLMDEASYVQKYQEVIDRGQKKYNNQMDELRPPEDIVQQLDKLDDKYLKDRTIKDKKIDKLNKEWEKKYPENVRKKIERKMLAEGLVAAIGVTGVAVGAATAPIWIPALLVKILQGVDSARGIDRKERAAQRQKTNN